MPSRLTIYFDRRDYNLLEIVNRMLEGEQSHLEAQRRFFHYFHPRGIKEMAETKGLRIAYAVIHLLESLERGRMEDRLHALRALRDEVLCGPDQGLQKNTARVLIEIMKDLVRAHGDPSRQLKLAHDFRIVASGKPRIVRSYLKRYRLLEMPEEWNQLAFDDHVHDANTKGRKSTTHLIMDAWIKGIRRLRVVYYNFIRPETAAELMEAAAIMGITVWVGIEFSASFYGRFVQLIWVPRGFADARDFLRFLSREPVRAFMDEGRAVSDYQADYVLAILDQFNRRHCFAVAEELGIDPPAMDPEEFLSFVGMGQASLLHLALFVHSRLLPLMEEKVAQLRQRYAKAGPDERREIEEAIERLDRFDPQSVYQRFLKPEQNPSVPDINRVSGMESLPSLMRLSPCKLVDRLVQLHSGYRITLNLSNLRVEDVLELLYDCNGRITRLEIFNLKDFSDGKVQHIPPIHQLQQAINSGNVIQLKRIILDIIEKMKADTDPTARGRVPKFRKILADIESLRDMYKIKPLRPRIGSDSTGQWPGMHGMGLAVMDSLPGRAQRAIFQQTETPRFFLPFYVDTSLRLVCKPAAGMGEKTARVYQWLRRVPGFSHAGMECRREWVAHEDFTRMVAQGNILTLGGVQAGSTNGFLPDPSQAGPHRLLFPWRYLQSSLKNFLKILAGFVPASLTFYLTHDWWVLMYFGAFIWFSITGLRNILQSVMGGGGIGRSHLLRWKDYVSWDRLADSLFFTGFSVPLLDFLTKTLLLDYGFGITTATHPVELYAVMAMVNGVYLTSHNLYRGLPKTVAYANFFRSIFSIPVAFGINLAAGSLLSAFGAAQVNTILQSWAAVISKTASDCVAGVIEGTVDRARNIRDRLNDYRHRLAQFFEVYARLNMHFPEADPTDLLEQPSEWFRSSDEDVRHQIRIMTINALDLLYFWMYQPRSRTAFGKLMSEMPPEERHILIRSQAILNMEREISQMFIDGVVGSNFSRPLAFYLSRYREYLKGIDRLNAAIEKKRSG